MTTGGAPLGASGLWPEKEKRKHEPAGPHIEVWRDESSFWQWMYYGTEDGTRLPSNRRYASREEAFQSAGIAYPLVPVREVAKPIRRHRRRLWPWLVFITILTLIGLSILVILGVSIAAVVLLFRGKRLGRGSRRRSVRRGR